ncbi:MAG: hypothetical protein IJU23_14105 [Proteobacteria bacterium]|nr:hypothetical protein [Pseudomonadota bacterium]
MRKNLYFLFFLMILSIPSLAMAKTEGDYLTAREYLTSTRGYGVANAMVASASGTAAIWHNPAGISSAKMYSVDAAYNYDNDVNGHGFEVNLVDMKSNEYVGAAVGFLYEHMAPTDGVTEHLMHLRFGVAVPLANDVISLGVGGVYSHILHNGDKLLGQFTLDAGVIVRPLSWLSVGFSAQNLIVGDYKAYMPRMIAVGISAGSVELGLNGMFEASFNISADDIAKSGSYGVGVEYVLKKLVPIRVGYRYEGEGHHVLAAGLGYRHNDGMFGLDLAYQHHFNDYSNEILSGSLGFYF